MATDLAHSVPGVVTTPVAATFSYLVINPCPARPVYIQFQVAFKPNNMTLKWIT